MIKRVTNPFILSMMEEVNERIKQDIRERESMVRVEEETLEEQYNQILIDNAELINDNEELAEIVEDLKETVRVLAALI